MGFLICGTWPREESNLRAWIRSPPLYPLSYGAVLGCTVSCAAHVVAVAQLVEPRVVIPVVAGSSPVRHLFGPQIWNPEWGFQIARIPEAGTYGSP